MNLYTLLLFSSLSVKYPRSSNLSRAVFILAYSSQGYSSLWWWLHCITLQSGSRGRSGSMAVLWSLKPHLWWSTSCTEAHNLPKQHQYLGTKCLNTQAYGDHSASKSQHIPCAVLREHNFISQISTGSLIFSQFPFLTQWWSKPIAFSSSCIRHMSWKYSSHQNHKRQERVLFLFFSPYLTPFLPPSPSLFLPPHPDSVSVPVSPPSWLKSLYLFILISHGFGLEVSMDLWLNIRKQTTNG